MKNKKAIAATQASRPAFVDFKAVRAWAAHVSHVQERVKDNVPRFAGFRVEITYNEYEDCWRAEATASVPGSEACSFTVRTWSDMPRETPVYDIVEVCIACGEDAHKRAVQAAHAFGG